MHARYRGLGRVLTAVVLVTLALGGGAVRTPVTATAQVASVAEPTLSAEAAATFDAVAQRAAELRGLTPTGEVEQRVLSPEQLRARMIADLDTTENREATEKSRRLMVALGLLAPDADLYRLELDFRSGVVLGQYDPETKQLFVISGAAALGPRERTTIAHEYTHALQDQNYDLQALMPRRSGNSDRTLAVSALVEGDAMITEQLYQQHALSRAEREEMRRQERTTSGGPDVDSMPLVLREESYFPYTAGPAFIVELLGEDAVREAVQRGTGYGAHVSPLFQNPPTSTAQVLHPEKYRQGIQPVEITLPDLAAALGNGWEALDQDVLGEIDHRILIAQYLDRDTAERAADGWAGDRFALLGRGDQTAVAVSTRWDTLADVREWLAAYREALQARYGASLRVLADAPDRLAWETPDGIQILRADATSTSLAIAPTEQEATRLEQALAGAPLAAASSPGR
jgi:hypothetical protein